MSTNTNVFMLPKKKYLVIKFIGSLSDQPYLTCVPSRWLKSYLDWTIFIQYPPSVEENKTVTQLITFNSPALSHWKSYLATLYYQTDSLEDAMLFAGSYASLHETQIASTSTSTSQNIARESISGPLATTTKLTLAEQFNIIGPLLNSMLHTINIFHKKHSGPLQASHNNARYQHLQNRYATYGKFVRSKMEKCMNLIHNNPANVDVATEIIRNEMERVVVQVLLAMNGSLK